ncbi:MAG: Mov34/MPN/PAD-1 family protein [Promethearchaeota archaeon]|jgi:proteasome lid subunit RPN8/RPN11
MRFEKDISFSLSKGIIGRINNCIKNFYPNEACGFMFGTVKEFNDRGDYKYKFYVEKFQCVESSILSPTSFLIDNDGKLLELANTILLRDGLKLLAILHSHPAGATPSSFDKESMKYYHNCGIQKFSHLVWIIVDSRNQNINGFIYLENKLTRIKVEIIEE